MNKVTRNPSRLDLLKILLTMGLFLFVNSCTNIETIENVPTPIRGLSILQGYTNESSTQISVLVPKSKSLVYTVTSDQVRRTVTLREISVQRHNRSSSKWQVDRIRITGLRSGEKYTLEIRDNYGQLVDAREFSTLNHRKPWVRIAAISRLNPNFVAEQRKMWALLLKQNPSALFILGGHTNALEGKPALGGTSPEIIWSNYVRSRLIIDFYRSPKLIPTFAVWNELDYGNTTEYRDFSLKSQSAEIFKIFFPQDDSIDGRFITGPGTSKYWRAFNIRFAFLDTVSFRPPRRPTRNTDTPSEESIIGSAQDRWLFRRVNESSEPLILVSSAALGAQFDFRSQSYSPPTSTYLIKKIDATPVSFMVLAGGSDTYEILDLRKPKFSSDLFEIHVGPFHDRTLPTPWAGHPKPPALDGGGNVLSFTLLELDQNSKNPVTKVSIILENGKKIANRTFALTPKKRRK